MHVGVPTKIPRNMAGTFSTLVPTFMVLAKATMVRNVYSVKFGAANVRVVCGIIRAPLRGVASSLNKTILVYFAKPFL